MKNAFKAELLKDTWAIEERYLESLLLTIDQVATDEAISKLLDSQDGVTLGDDDKIHGHFTDPQAAKDKNNQGGSSRMTIKDGVATIPIQGVLMNSIPWWFSFFGIAATSYVDIQAPIRAALKNKRVESVLLHISSPGGNTTGVKETADQIYAARDEKPVNAFIEGQGASAAYWLASQSNFIGASRNAAIGSIGTYTTLRDSSKAATEAGIKVIMVRSGVHKGVGEPGVPITEDQVSAIQEYVDAINSTFIDGVSQGRSLDKAAVEALATGRFWETEQAQALGLIDKVTNLSNVMQDASEALIFSKGEMEMSDKDKPEVNAEAIRAEEAAKLQERVKAFNEAFPEDPGYAMQACAAGKSLLEAQAEYNAVLKQQLEEAQAQTAEAKAAAEEAAEKAAANVEGNEGLEFDEAAAGGSGQEDFMARANEIKKENPALTMRAAMKAARKEDPAAHDSWVQNQKKVPKEL